MSHTFRSRGTSLRPALRAGRRVVVVGALASLALLGEPADARINPYHVVQSGANEGTPHRIMVLIDTSPSMSAPADGSADVCVFDECEDDTAAGQSKLNAAKYAMRQLVAATDGLAEWSFVGFTREALGNNHPGDCGTQFRWASDYESLANSGGTTSSITVDGHAGQWQLCGDHEGFPYVRYDNARYNNPLPNDLTTAVTSPAPEASPGDFSNAWHETRDVQWFPAFMGVRFQPTSTQFGDSQGDYGSAGGDTFYYWPYVDGFPGYSDFAPDTGATMGVNGETSQQSNPLEFYGPLYIDPSLFSLNPNYDGPSSAAEAQAALLASLETMQDGGVDLSNDAGWQWDNLLGSTSAVAENANSIFSSTNLNRNVRWTNDRLDQIDEGCGGFSVIIISDGVNGFGSVGSAQNEAAFERLSGLHEDYGVDTYVIGFNASVNPLLNELACAGGGGCENAGTSCNTPCSETSNSGFDTCADSSNPTSECSWNATDPDELVAQFSSIVAEILDIDVDSGQGAVVNSFGVAGDEDALSQTLFRAYTEAGSWQGHVERSYCIDEDPDNPGSLAPYCEQPATEFDLPDEAIDTSFGGCSTQTRAWDAGTCLAAHPIAERRLYTHDSSNDLIDVLEADGTATAAFQSELTALGLLTAGSEAAEADAIAQFVSGVNAPGGWRLPGLANSSPIVVKRIPEYDSTRQPEVGIRDPHCGGRYYNELDAGALPQSLYDFAEDAWDETLKIGTPADFVYQEAVLVGDDMGVLHAFQLDSGNELWGFIPRGVLANLAKQAANGPQNMGQPLEIADHIFGIASTVNQAWVHDPGPDPVDPADDSWRHLAVFGIGSGGAAYDDLGVPEQGAEYYALDISHMHPEYDPGGGPEPIEILWTTEDDAPLTALKAVYDPLLGQTWARPAITYWVPNEAIENPPEAYLVMGSGYAVDGTAGQGRTLIRANALTGELVETAVLPAVGHPVYESDFGAVVDPAVGSHCISRFWAEAQETYIADPAGRVFRWDVGRTTAHAADSGGGGAWGDGGTAATIDHTGTTPYFPACTGTGATCTVGSIPGANGDVFVFPPGVTANDRIDDFSAVANGTNPGGEDQFLVALISGSSYEDTIDGYDTGLDFHSSIYLLVDDHTGAPSEGFTIPAGAPKSVTSTAAAGAVLTSDATANYFRIALTDIERTRVITIDGTEVLNETANFKRQTRPIRAPRVVITGAADTSSGEAQIIEGVEVVFIEFTVYEPPDPGCNDAFVDASGQLVADVGSTYILRFRLTSDNTSGFNLTTGSTGTSTTFGGFSDNGLTLQDVEQLGTDNGGTGNSGPVSSLTSGNAPCAPGTGGGAPLDNSAFAVPIRSATISGFSPVE